jgi:hypothetical protein
MKTAAAAATSIGWTKINTQQLPDSFEFSQFTKSNELIIVYHEFLDENNNIIEYDIEMQIDSNNPNPITFRDAAFFALRYQGDNTNFIFEKKFFAPDKLYKVRLMDYVNPEKRTYVGFIIRSMDKTLDLYKQAVG